MSHEGLVKHSPLRWSLDEWAEFVEVANLSPEFHAALEAIVAAPVEEVAEEAPKPKPKPKAKAPAKK